MQMVGDAAATLMCAHYTVAAAEEYESRAATGNRHPLWTNTQHPITMNCMEPPIHNREAEADRIIRKHVGMSAGTGLIPVPLADMASVAALQLTMLKQLARVYGQDFDSDMLRSFVATMSTVLIGNLVARIGGSVTKAVPIFGPVLGGATQATLSAASTYAVGRIFKRYLINGLPIDTIDTQAIRVEARREYENGKRLAMDRKPQDCGHEKGAD